MIQEVRDAQPGLGQLDDRYDQYNVDGALLFLEEYFVNASYDRPKFKSALYGSQSHSTALSLSVSDWIYLTYYMQRVEPIVEEPNEQFGYAMISFRVRVGEDVTYRQAHRATAAYYGMIEWMDAQFNRVIEKLGTPERLRRFLSLFSSLTTVRCSVRKDSGKNRVILRLQHACRFLSGPPKRFGREPQNR